MNNVIYISGVTDTLPPTTILPQRVYKGEVQVAIDFSNLSEGIKKVLQINVTFGDGATHTEHYRSDILDTVIHHTYKPSFLNYLKDVYCNVSLTFHDFSVATFITSIVIAQPSFLSEYESLTVKNVQFIDNDNISDMLVILESGKHNIYNVRLSAKTLNTGETAPQLPIDKLVTDLGDSIVTDLYNNIKIST